MTKVEFVYYFLGSIFYILLIGGFIWFIINLFRVRKYEAKINELYNELETKIKKEKERSASLFHTERMIKNLQKKYEPKIKESERKRNFVLDKLPFVK